MVHVKQGQRKTIAKIAIIVLFVVIAVIMARFHEPWSDEAQSFLIARDNSIGEIFYWSKYEGTTPLWFLIIKAFLCLGGTYETFFLLPLLFTVIGLIIFEFKVKAPWYIKLLLPFTYFILYQYTIVARSYCLVFPALMWIASVYGKRKTRRYAISYCLALLFLMNICSYTLLVAGSFWLIDVFDMMWEKSFSKKKILASSMLLIALFAVFLLMLPRGDCAFDPIHPRSLFDLIYHATIGGREVATVSSVLVTMAFLSVIFVALTKEKAPSKKAVDLLILFVPVSMEHIVMKSEIWHIGIVSILIITAFIINDMINHNLYIKIMILAICLVQIVWSGISIGYDVGNNYSASEDVAEFLKQNMRDGDTVYGLDFDVVAIQPYFEYNVFKNQRSEKSFWNFKRNNGYIQNRTLLWSDDAIFVISDYYILKYVDIYNELKRRGYEEYHFEGGMFTKTYIHEDKGYYVLMKNAL